jgi:hypothetical protein
LQVLSGVLAAGATSVLILRIVRKLDLGIDMGQVQGLIALLVHAVGALAS